MMNQDTNCQNQKENRSSPRHYLDKFHSIEFHIKELPYIYRFRLRDRSESGMCVVIQENSEIMRHLHQGDVLDVKYCPGDISDPVIKLKTRIMHITKTSKTSPNGHFYVGLLVLSPLPIDKPQKHHGEKYRSDSEMVDG
ncbi:MAG: PilZ domain-containing protein [Desulfobacterium sp.]|jgi:hypothetical protein|nr:PilZ domain-containing protein [Desulfobacterium sp.]